jgi:hypothetical protein
MQDRRRGDPCGEANNDVRPCHHAAGLITSPVGSASDAVLVRRFLFLGGHRGV